MKELDEFQAAQERIRELETVIFDAKGYLTRLFQFLAPQCVPEDKLIYLCTQIDNYIAGQNIKIARLEAALKEKP